MNYNFNIDLKNADNEMLNCAISLVNKLKNSNLSTTPFCSHVNSYSNIYSYSVYCTLVKNIFQDTEKKILDWGGQYGHVTNILSTYFKNVCLYLPVSVQEYEKKKIKTFISDFHYLYGISNIKNGLCHEKINLPDKSYDCVISSGVLEHVREEGKNTEIDSLKEIHRILKPDGLLIVWNLPNKYSLVEFINKIMNRSVHDYKYNKKDLLRMTTMSGFKIEILERHEIFNMSIRRALSFLFGIKLSWKLDYIISKFPIINIFSQHFTLILRKI